MSTYMKTYRHRCLKLRIGVALAAILGLGLLYSPTFVVVNDAFAQPAPTTQPATKAPAPAPKVETKGTVTVTDTKKDEAKKDAPAAATSEKEQSWWQAMLAPVLSVLGLFIAAFLAAGLRKLVQLIEKKWNIDIPDSIEKMMIDKARWAVAWAEEKAEKRLLYGDGQKTDGAQKVSEVVDLLEKFAQNLGYGEEWQREKIEALAEGVLHLERDKGVGSNGNRAAKLEEKKNGNG